MAASMANESNASGARAGPPATYSYDQSSYAYNQPDDYEMKVLRARQTRLRLVKTTAWRNVCVHVYVCMC